MPRIVAVLVITAALIGWVRPAAAERWRIGGELDLGAAGTSGAIGDELDATFLMRLGAVAEFEGISLGVHGGMGMAESHDPLRDGAGLMLLELGASLGYRVVLTRTWNLVPRLGVRRDWFDGSQRVTRTCDQTGACDAGFYQAEPWYRSTGPAASLRLQLAVPPGEMLVGGVGLTVGWQHLELDLPGLGPTGGNLWTLSFSAEIGAAR